MVTKNIVLMLIILIVAGLLYYQYEHVEKIDFGNDLKISEESGILTEQILSE